MKNKEILEKLNKVFGKFKFFDEDHHYECNGKRVGISVTRLIEEYAQEFNADEVAEKVAKRDRKTKDEVLEEWQYKNEFACRKGSTCHEYAQSLWSGEHWTCDNFDFSADFHHAVFTIKKLADKFYCDFTGEYNHLADEFVIGSEEYDIASAVDHLFINNNGELILIDYKTNTYITGYNKEAFEKPMKPPLEHLNDDKLTHYELQLSIYKYLIEKYTDLKIYEMKIIYMSELNNNYEIIEIPYLENEVKKLLEWRNYE